jgi:hypothetical protein
LQAGEGHQLTAVERRLARHLAAVAANEGALWSPRDLELIWQTVENRADTAAGRDRWLRQHSGRVLGTRKCRSGNCRWSSQLGRGKTIPAAVAAGKAGYWRVVVLPRYRELLRRARQLVAGRPYEKPCHIEPYTWGGVGKPGGVDDRPHAADNGLYPIGCEGTLNDGFTTRGVLSQYRRELQALDVSQVQRVR